MFWVLLVLLVVIAAYLLFWPVSIDPVAWTAPVAPGLKGVYEPNTFLDCVERHYSGQLPGPEDITMDAQGRLYTGVVDGRILRLSAEGDSVETFAATGGRPLGMAWDAHGNLIVADALKGLLSVDPQGTVSVLATEAEGLPFGFTDDVDVAQDGTIYFTDASWKFHPPNYMADLMEGRGNGRLLAYDPKTKTARTLVRDLHFANGVSISPDQSFVLVNETWKYRVLRYWLTGGGQGEWDVFIDNLPGFPDNIASNGAGMFWLALFTVRNPVADALAPHPFLRKVAWRSPQFMLPKAKPFSFVLGLNAAGDVVHNLQGPAGRLSPVTSVNEFGDYLYLGSVEDNAIGRVRVPAAQR
ncbi:MAG: strictosidine synthase family protein [Candidatus Hydrogenedentes bacterium]|nr:strictosidine synthase family protein [Candidatus Hydrogenedentota bacterium]